MVADSARPQLDKPEIINANQLDARITQTDGTILDVDAQAGTFNSDSKDAVLTGGVIVASSNGYTMTTDQMRARFDGSAMDADSAVVVDGPDMRIEAGSMRVRLNPTNDGDRGYVVVFNGGVKLVYTPKD